MPLVSIIIPCWNAGSFLEGLFKSLADQTFTDFEVIVVDDGSDDAATRTALSRLPPHICVHRQENRGLSGARNSGFSLAKGKFVLPLDCDDRLEPEFLSKAIQKLETDQSVDFVFSHMRLTGGREGILERAFNPFDQLFLNQLPYALLMHKSCWEIVGGYDETMRGGYEDWDFNLRLIAAGFRGHVLPEPLFIYRVADDGMLLAKSARRHGVLWRQIREKHPDSYKIGNLLHLKRKSGPGKVSGLVAATLLGSAILLPDILFGWLFHRALRNRGNNTSSQRSSD